MAKRAAGVFERKLRSLFDRRVDWMVSVVRGGRRGRPRKLDRHLISKTIRELKDLASACLTQKFFRQRFDQWVEERRQWQVTSGKGWGRDRKRRSFDKWFAQNISHSNCVYAFWSGRTCRYIGRTIKGKGRPQAHFEKHWFSRVTRIDIYSTASARAVPQLECLAMHRFRPTENRRRAARQSRTKHCPVCEIHRWIEDDVRYIFALR